jgi:DNA-binding transcriptional LysR family regulator
MAQGTVDILVARLFAQHDKTALRFEPLAEEPVVAIVRPGHPLLSAQHLSLFREHGLDAPANLIETAALLFVTKMIGQGDMIGLVAGDVGRYYAGHALVAVLPVELPCHMDAFGLITRTDRPLAPAAKVMLAAIRGAAAQSYGVRLEARV